jgi:hypothetical protein
MRRLLCGTTAELSSSKRSIIFIGNQTFYHVAPSHVVRGGTKGGTDGGTEMVRVTPSPVPLFRSFYITVATFALRQYTGIKVYFYAETF